MPEHKKKKSPAKLDADTIAVLSHELKTPLTILKSAIENLSGNVIKPENHERLLDMCRRSIDRLIRLIDENLDFAKINSGTLHVYPKPMQILEHVRHVLQSLRVKAEEKGVNLVDSMTTDDSKVLVDSDRFEQILLNLVDNAIKYTPKGGKVMVRLVKRDHFVEIHVEDTGIGIVGKDQARIFETFQQVPARSKDNQSGVGLGLAIVKALVNAHGGTISVKSKEGLGSDFFFTLPLAK
jgi:two-component system, OmpR family, phosphate regulon sensor histidine kinase PhoR